MAVLWVLNIFFPVRYSYSNPSEMKMLKSSPIPKMKVEMMMLTMLNSIPKIAINPKMMNQLSAIGVKESSASSNRP